MKDVMQRARCQYLLDMTGLFYMLRNADYVQLMQIMFRGRLFTGRFPVDKNE